MPVTCAHEIHKKRDPRSDFEKNLAQVDEQLDLVFACPYGCKQGKVDTYGHCEHLFGFTNARLPDGAVEAVPEGAEVEVLSNDRDRQKRRLHTDKRVPLAIGDYLVRVNGTSRRVYRQAAIKDETASKDAAAGKDASSNKNVKQAPVG